MKIDDILTYKDSQMSTRYGTGVVTSVTSDEYTILWSARGSTKYRRSVIDGKLEEVFQRLEEQAHLPKERLLQLHKSRAGVPFNENYDRTKLARLCEQLKLSGKHKVKAVAEGLSAELFTKRLVLRGAAKAVLYQLAELCDTRGSSPCDDALDISRELFFGYVLQKSDFHDPERDK